MGDVEKAAGNDVPDSVTMTKAEEGGSGEDPEGTEEGGEERGGEMEISLGCGILGRYPIISLLSFVILGVCIGVGLSYWRPETEEDMNSKDVALQWIGLVGDLFLRMLKCIVLPLVFVNVIIAVVDMMQVGKAGGVGGRTVLLYLCTTIMAGIIAVVFSVIFKRWYLRGDVSDASPAYVTLGCRADNSSYLMEDPTTGTISCTSEYPDENSILWTFGDVNSTFMTTGGGTEVTEVSLSDTIYEGVFLTLIPENIFQEFYNANYAAVIIFAIAAGVACSKIMERLDITSADLTFMSLLVELDQILMIMICWVIMITPFAVLSLVAQTIGAEQDLGALFANMGLLIACILCCYATQFFLTYCGGYFLLAKRRNPFKYMSHLAPAQIMAFASSSSAATIPLSIESVQSTGLVHDSITRFVIPLGATVNMDGAGIQIVCSCVWLAVYNGIALNPANYILLVIISTFGSMGTAPVPNAVLALIATSYNTVFNATGNPDGFSFLFAIDWLMDRFSTMLNVTGDMTVSGIIGAMVDIDSTGGTRETVVDQRKSQAVLFEAASQALYQSEGRSITLSGAFPSSRVMSSTSGRNSTPVNADEQSA